MDGKPSSKANGGRNGSPNHAPRAHTSTELRHNMIDIYKAMITLG